MALGKLHSLRGEKSALIMVKANKFQMNWSCAYVPREAVEGIAEGETFPLPDGYKLAAMVDSTTGEVRTTKNGATLHTLIWE
jgi:hypothetical protein